MVEHFGSSLGCKARLANSTGTIESDKSHVRPKQQGADLGDLAPTSDQRAARRRQIMGRGLHSIKRREHLRKIGCGELEHAFGLCQIPKVMDPQLPEKRPAREGIPHKSLRGLGH